MQHEFYAHSVEGKPTHKWHLLEGHLKDTAELSAKFADAFGCAGNWGIWRGCGMMWGSIRG
jgi:hypothetical protein